MTQPHPSPGPGADPLGKTRIGRETQPGLAVVTISRPKLSEMVATLQPLPGESLPALFQRFARILQEREVQIVQQTLFGSVAAFRSGLDALAEACGEVDWPITWVEGNSCTGGPIAGLQVQAVSGVPVATLRLGDRILGRVFEDDEGQYCFLGGVGPTALSLSRADQSRQVLETLEAALRLAGMDWSHVVRTWFFLDDLLSWYDQFNAVRTGFFRERNVFEGVVPASTGVEGRNPADAALVAQALAVLAKGDAVTVREVPSPLQCPAPRYGSSFSRAVEVTWPDHRRLLISGTASIDPEGRSVHLGDVTAQVAWTLDVVEAILCARQMGFSDVSRAVAYFKSAQDAPAFDRYGTDRGLPPLPVVVAESDICRDELLFEIELDAIAGPLPL